MNLFKSVGLCEPSECFASLLVGVGKAHYIEIDQAQNQPFLPSAPYPI